MLWGRCRFCPSITALPVGSGGAICWLRACLLLEDTVQSMETGHRPYVIGIAVMSATDDQDCSHVSFSAELGRLPKPKEIRLYGHQEDHDEEGPGEEAWDELIEEANEERTAFDRDWERYQKWKLERDGQKPRR